MSYQSQTVARKDLRLAATALSNGSFDASPITWRISSYNQVTLLCTVASFAATSVDIQVEFAFPAETPGTVRDPDPVAADWFARSFLDTSAATASTVTMNVPCRKMQWSFVGNGTYEVPIPVMSKWMRVKAQTTGVPAGTTLSIVGVIGMA